MTQISHRLQRSFEGLEAEVKQTTTGYLGYTIQGVFRIKIPRLLSQVYVRQSGTNALLTAYNDPGYVVVENPALAPVAVELEKDDRGDWHIKRILGSEFDAVIGNHPDIQKGVPQSLLDDITSIHVDISNLETDLTALTAIVSGHTTTLASHTSTLASHTSTLASHTSTLASHTSTLSSHTTTLASHTSDLAAHAAELADHESRIATLEAGAGVYLPDTDAWHDPPPTTIAEAINALAEDEYQRLLRFRLYN